MFKINKNTMTELKNIFPKNKPGEFYLVYKTKNEKPKTNVVIYGIVMLNKFNLKKFLYYLQFLININGKTSGYVLINFSNIIKKYII